VPETYRERMRLGGFDLFTLSAASGDAAVYYGEVTIDGYPTIPVKGVVYQGAVGNAVFGYWPRAYWPHPSR
jgi:hypothetical protein